MTFIGWVAIVGAAWIGAGVLAVTVVLLAARRYSRRHFPRVGGTGTLGRTVRVTSTPHRERNGRRERRDLRDERAA